jgi:hypothetical protein
MRTNYILVDYENVQPATLNALEKEHFKVIVFVGANQSKINYEVVSSMQRLGANASYIRISSNGYNALDFLIAFYIGQLAVDDPSAYFHIISKDTGFDPLITHLKTRKIFANRSSDIDDIPIIKAANSNSLPEKVDIVVANLKQRSASKPRTVKTLSGTISSIFRTALSENEIAEILKYLAKQGIITITDNKVSYSIPEGKDPT